MQNSAAPHDDQPDDFVSLTFLEELLPFLTAGSEVYETQLKRWRYSVPTPPRSISEGWRSPPALLWW